MTKHKGLRWTLYPALAVTLGVGMLAAPAAADHLPWHDPDLPPEQRATMLLEVMSLEQKIQQIAIREIEEDPELEECVLEFAQRTIVGIPELGIPTFRMTNGGTGIRGGSCQNPLATGVPSTTAAAATFDRELNYEYGTILGEEARLFAHQVLLGPATNLVRHPYGGRNYEYFSEDPFLSGALAVEQIRGAQDQGVHVQLKHFARNEQETERWTTASRIPSRAMHELYLLPFEMAIKDGDVASIMCAFPHLNGDWACENDQLLRDTLYDEWGFDGWIMSDRRATHSTAEAILAGNGVELDFGPEWYTEELIGEALDAGEIDESDIDALLHPRYTKMFEFGLMDEPFDEFVEVLPGEEGQEAGGILLGDEAFYRENGEVARRIAEAGITLLRNEPAGDDTENILPLDGDEGEIALIGHEWYTADAKMAPRSSRSENAHVFTQYTISPQEGLETVIDELGGDSNVTYYDGTDLEEAADAAADADVVILMVGDDPRETADKTTLGFPVVPEPGTDDSPSERVDQEELIDAVIGQNDNTIVVLKTSGMALLPWVNRVPAIVAAWYPGQEDGLAVANILYGRVNPSGKTPVTWGKAPREAAYTRQTQWPGGREDTGLPGGPGFDPEDHVFDQRVARYIEGLEMGYRWFEAHNIAPQFPFGHGLSYTTFEYSDLAVSVAVNDGGEPVLEVSFTVTNTGDMAGAEAAQVYLTLPEEADEPSKRLVGFDKPYLEPGASETVTVTLDAGAANHPLSYFAPENPDDITQWAAGEWVTPEGTYTVHVGGSSASTPLETDVQIPAPPAPPQRFGFFLTNSWGGGDADYAFMYGRHTDEVLVGDWNGDGRDSITVRRGKTYFVNNHPRGGPAESVFMYGRADDVVLVGDWDGDGVDTLAVRRGKTYHVKNSLRGGDADRVIHYGRAEDDILVGDWNGDGRDTFAVRRGKTYYVKNSLRGGDADVVFMYGKAGDLVYAGDWDGNGRDSFLVRRGKEYHVKNSLRGGPADVVMLYGRATDEVYIGDWDGNGTDTVGVRRTPATVAAAQEG